MGEDARNRKWVSVVRKALSGKTSDTLVSDESCLAEEMNVAWAEHEFTSQYAEEILNFCEGKDIDVMHGKGAVTLQGSAVVAAHEGEPAATAGNPSIASVSAGAVQQQPQVSP